MRRFACSSSSKQGGGVTPWISSRMKRHGQVKKRFSEAEGPGVPPKLLPQFIGVLYDEAAGRHVERRRSHQPLHRFLAEFGGKEREVGRRRLAVCLVVEGRDVGRAAEGEKLPQGEIVRLVLGPVDARQMDQVQVGAAEGLSREDAAVHRQDDGAPIGDAGRVAQPHHLDRCAAPAVQPQFLCGDEVLGERRPLITHERAEPLQFVAQRDRPLERGTVGLVEFVPPGW